MLYCQTTKDISWPLKVENLKMTKIFKKKLKKLQKLLSFCMFVFEVPEPIAHKKVIASHFVSQKAFIIFQKLQRKTKRKKHSWQIARK